MSQRQNISTGTHWEGVAGYSRAVRVGNTVHVSGTVAADDDGLLVGADDPYAQTQYIIQKITRALNVTGASIHDVVRTRMYVTDISRWEPVAQAHGEAFGDIRPATTMVEVSKLIDSGYLIEIEAFAIINEGE